MGEIIEPRVLKGFRDFLPEAEIERKALMEILERSFRSFGFVPIDTPVLEYADILLGKGGGETDKQVYRFRDHGDRDVALRFDLTVPFARFMAEHVDELYLPFRRYHMAKVWRGENTQRGRYREFMQCDFDIVGTDSASADADIVLLARDALAALKVGPFTIRLNHRGLFNRFLARIGAAESSPAVLRAVDKIGKIGSDETKALVAAEIGEERAVQVLNYIATEGSFEETLAKLEGLAGGPGADSARLRSIGEATRGYGTASLGAIVLDPRITRGLDYYTGLVFETVLDAMPEIGSICGGGRYDELASLYTKRVLPGVGAAIGLDRLLAALEAGGRARRGGGYSQVLILDVEEALESRYHAIAGALRAASLSCEVYPEKRKLAQQFSYAERKGIPLAVIVGSDELGRSVAQLRDLGARAGFELPYPDGDLSALIAKAKGLLAEAGG